MQGEGDCLLVRRGTSRRVPLCAGGRRTAKLGDGAPVGGRLRVQAFRGSVKYVGYITKYDGYIFLFTFIYIFYDSYISEYVAIIFLGLELGLGQGDGDFS